MSEEARPEQTPQPTAPAAPSNGAGKPERLVPSFRLEQESTRAREAVATRDEALKQLAGIKEEFERLQQQYSSTRENHAIDLHLIERGFKHQSVQRFFRNEYRASVADMPADKRPEFSQWLEDNREDPLYRVHFQNSAAPAPEPAQQAPAPTTEDSLLQALRAVVTGNPDAHTGQPPAGNETEWTAEAIRKQRAKNGGTLGDAKDAILAQWRAKGVIK